ncbi:MAG: 50S ribosomal protein L18 [Anaerolineae bacterium]
MESQLLKRNETRLKRTWRVRKQVRGTSTQPRLSVYKTNKHISAQLIDDEKGITLVSAGTIQAENRKGKFSKKSKEAAKHVGTKIAEMAKEKNVQKVVFDRGRFKYHGMIAELANAAREAGLEF